MSDYPPVTSHIYSLVRFWRDLREDALPEVIHVAGEIVCESFEKLRNGQFFLMGQNLNLSVNLQESSQNFNKNFKVELGSFKSGDKVQIQFGRQNLTNSGEVTALTQLILLAPQKREPVYMQVSPLVLQQWSTFIDQVRSYFKSRGLLEVLTPSLVQNPGMEVELEPFGVELKVGSLQKKLFLPTSPELHLKQMLANGLTDIFEIKTCFRNGEITAQHEPEFQMLEWYRAYSNLENIREDLKGLLKAVAGDRIEVRMSSMKELFRTHLAFDLAAQTTAAELAQLCERAQIDHTTGDDWNELFHRLFVEKIEPFIGQEQPEIVYDFPPTMAALARLTSEGFADRFELFWRGFEIANAFHELNDPTEQRQRFEHEITLRADKGRTALTIDENFMRALDAGLPPAGGIALGLDRLFMAIYSVTDIGGSRAFGIKHQLRNGR